jgi:Fe(II)/alpha-ketoglutarate-dependent arginine beta-hydroxylase
VSLEADVHRITLSDGEVAAILPLVDEICAKYRSIEDERLIGLAALYAHELPRRLRGFLERYRVEEPAAVCVISGFPVADEAIGPTPEHWNLIGEGSPAMRQEIFLLLCGVLLGDVFAWATQQDGRIMHNVLPIKAHREEQLGTGSEMVLWWHTEDTFSPFKGDYVALMCLRNPDDVGTTICDADAIDWSGLDIGLLFAAEYPIRPDDSHLPKIGVGDRQKSDPVTERLLAESCRRIIDQYENPRKKPVLYGDPARPYMSLDPYYMLPDQMAPHARAAFDAFTKAIDAALTRVVLRPGDIAFIDNFRAVHGRDPFTARYDGTDRWLKRLNITRNLRISRAARRSSTDRVVF